LRLSIPDGVTAPLPTLVNDPPAVVPEKIPHVVAVVPHVDGDWYEWRQIPLLPVTFESVQECIASLRQSIDRPPLTEFNYLGNVPHYNEFLRPLKNLFKSIHYQSVIKVTMSGPDDHQHSRLQQRRIHIRDMNLIISSFSKCSHLTTLGLLNHSVCRETTNSLVKCMSTHNTLKHVNLSGCVFRELFCLIELFNPCGLSNGLTSLNLSYVNMDIRECELLFSYLTTRCVDGKYHQLLKTSIGNSFNNNIDEIDSVVHRHDYLPVFADNIRAIADHIISLLHTHRFTVQPFKVINLCNAPEDNERLKLLVDTKWKSFSNKF